MNVALSIEEILKPTIDRTLSVSNKSTVDSVQFPDVEYVETDNLGEVVEKLAILHIRTWMLEDAIQLAKSDTEIADLKRKIDICFKVKRPKYVQAINKMIDNAIVYNKSLVEDSVKLYKGIDNG
jgi:hypothetical protein